MCKPAFTRKKENCDKKWIPKTTVKEYGYVARKDQTRGDANKRHRARMYNANTHKCITRGKQNGGRVRRPEITKGRSKGETGLKKG